MPNVETCRALLAKAEEAKDGGRELDAELWWHLSGSERIDRRMLRYAAKNCVLNALDATYTMGWRDVPRGIVPPLTTSIDAALALVGKVLPEWDVSLELSGKADSFIGWATLQGPEFSDHDMRQWNQSEGIRPMPLAILDALLRALLQQSETAHVER